MRILHTADWHLGDRLGRIDRTADLQRAVERIADICKQERIDVLLIAGDLFSEVNRTDGFRAAFHHLRDVFLPFLHDGGTIVAVTGNHDNESFCRMLCNALTLAAPVTPTSAVVPTGRFYLASMPGSVRLEVREDVVEFLLLPYPTPATYLTGESGRFAGFEEKNQALTTACAAQLHALVEESARHDYPTILAAHLHAEGAVVPSLFRVTEKESVILKEATIPKHLTYVALGHIHQPQDLYACRHIRYSGSIERLDMGERADAKSVTIFDVGRKGLHGEISTVPLDATPMYEISIQEPARDLPTLRERYPDADRALVKLHLRYRAGVDNLQTVLAELQNIFPRWYDRDWEEAGASDRKQESATVAPLDDVGETVRRYLNEQLQGNAHREAVLQLAEELLESPS